MGLRVLYLGFLGVWGAGLDLGLELVRKGLCALVTTAA